MKLLSIILPLNLPVVAMFLDGEGMLALQPLSPLFLEA